MSRKYFLILGLFLAAGFLFLNTNTANAYLTTATWTGGGDKTTWTDPGNWDNTCSGCYPGASTTDTIIIGAHKVGVTGDVVVRATTTLVGSISSLTLGVVNTGGPRLIIGNGAVIAASTTVKLVATSTLFLGDATWGSGTLKFNNADTNAVPFQFGTTTTAFTAATGTVTFTGTGGGIVVATTTYYNLTFTPTSTAATRTYRFNQGGSSCSTTTGCTATTTVSNALTLNEAAQANFDSVAVVLSGSGTVFEKANGTFIANGSLVKYTNASTATNVATGTYDNLVISGASITKTLLGNTTATSTVAIESGTLAISTFTFTATGATWTNSSTVTEGTGGKIVLASASRFDNGSGTAKSTFDGDARNSVGIQVTDTSLNLLAATIETQTAAVTAVSAIRDTETVTLTETTASSGIFRGSVQLNLSGTNVGGALDYQGPGTLSYTFTDSQDSSDTGTGGAGTFTGTAPSGGGGGAVVVVTPAVPATPATPAVPTETPAVPATPATPAAPSLESVSTKIASVVAKVAALTKDSPAADIAAVQEEIAAILNDIKAIQAAQPAPKGVALGFNFVRPLALGMTHNDVRNLQTALKTDSSVYQEGTVSGYFGPLTLKAVKKFQEKYGLASSGDAGYGNVGPKTRAKLNELYGGK